MPDFTENTYRPQLTEAQVARVLATLDRAKLDIFAEVAIGLMDFADGDPDAEEIGDEEDQSYLEASGPRGHVADGRASPIEDDEDCGGGGDQAWVEWASMRGSAKRGPNFTRGQEDDEDDDGGGDCTDDEPGFNRRSRTIANVCDGSGAGCAINGDREPNGDEGDYSDGKVEQTGVDQARPISAANPAVL